MVELARTFARPVVATAVGDLPRVVRDGETGLLVPPGDAEALAAALVRLLEDPATAQRMGEAARAHSVAESSWATVAARVDEELERWLGQRPARAAVPSGAR